MELIIKRYISHILKIKATKVKLVTIYPKKVTLVVIGAPKHAESDLIGFIIASVMKEVLSLLQLLFGERIL